MVESGSTTNYQGNGLPFPNWLVYDSSLFEVKLNDHDAVFLAPAPRYGTSATGRLEYNYLSAWQEGYPHGPDNYEFNLFVNINEDGTVDPRPLINRESYIVNNGDGGEAARIAPMSLEGGPDQFIEEGSDGEENTGYVLDRNKPLYLYTLDYNNMPGKSRPGYNIFDFPRVECKELNLIIFYDPDYGRWRIHTGDPQTSIVLKWRFKELVTVSNSRSPQFIQLGDVNSSEYYANPYTLTNPYISLIANEVDSKQFEIHAYTPLTEQDIHTNVFPRYQGVPLVAWPNIYNLVKNNPILAIDESVRYMPISANVYNGNSILRINNEPAWILENTLLESETYNIELFRAFEWSSWYGGEFEKGIIENGGYLDITDGTNTVRFNGNTGTWSILTSNVESLIIEMMFDNNQADSYNGYVQVYFQSDHYSAYPVFDDYNYFYTGFRLVNPDYLNKINSIEDRPSATDKFINHEWATCSPYNANIAPNFEVYGFENYKLLINGNEVEPYSITRGVNDVVTRASYIDGYTSVLLSVDLENLYTNIDYDYERHMHTVVEQTGGKYFLSGDRTDNLEMNPVTCIFNRCVPVVFEWVYKGEVPLDEYIPLFCYMRNNEIRPAVPLEQGVNQGLYIEYFYTETGKTARYAFAPAINETDGLNYDTLVRVHPRDAIRGWEKNGYTGNTINLDGQYIFKDKIAFPLIIRPDAENPDGPGAFQSRPLPLAFTAENLGLSGTFDIFVNGQRIIANASADEVITQLIEQSDIGINVTEEESPNLLLQPQQTTEFSYEGDIDISVNGENLVGDMPMQSLVELKDLSFENGWPLVIKVIGGNEPVEEAT